MGLSLGWFFFPDCINTWLTWKASTLTQECRQYLQAACGFMKRLETHRTLFPETCFFMQQWCLLIWGQWWNMKVLKTKLKDRKCFFRKIIRAWFWTRQKQNDKPSWDFERSAYRKLCLSYIYLPFKKNICYIYIYFYFLPLFSVKAVYTKTECLFSEFICCCCCFSSWSHNTRSVTSPLATRAAQCHEEFSLQVEKVQQQQHTNSAWEQCVTVHIASHGEKKEGRKLF